MDVRLTPEQEMFRAISASLAAELAARWDHGRSPETVADCTPSPADRQRIASAGWLALREEAGTEGGGCIDVCVLAEQLGYHLVPAPVLGHILAFEQLRLRGADAELLADLAGGSRQLAPVLTSDLSAFATEPHGIVFDTAGVSTAVVLGDRASTFEIAGSATGADLTRQLARPGAPAREDWALEAATSESDDRSLAFALTVISADLLGVMGAALDHAVVHAKTRRQFGAPIGSFQAIAHLAAECLVSLEATRSAIWYSAWAVDELSPLDALTAARTTKAFAAVAAVEVTEATIQILGGLGMTWESHGHLWQRRAHLDRQLFGDEHTQYRLLAQL